MEIGASIWYRHKTLGWVAGFIESSIDYDNQELIKHDSKENLDPPKITRTLSTTSSRDDNANTCDKILIIKLLENILDNNETTIKIEWDSISSINDVFENEQLKLRNQDNENYVEDLINLPHLHEPAILHTLHLRYNEGHIYTYTGPILIAVNPFENVPLYTSSILENYFNWGLAKSQGICHPGSDLPPHVYAVADNAYREMMYALMNSYSNHSESNTNSPSRTFAENQSILISGESGAGKTESTKIVLNYLTAIGNDDFDGDVSGDGDLFQISAGSIMDKILKSNPILEAFGNARTKRNDNSSRFGKYIQLQFNKRGKMIGGALSTYLLEKIRVPSHQSGERNFHVFYQMFNGLDIEVKKALGLTNIKDYWYTSQGNIYDLRFVDDNEGYTATIEAFSSMEHFGSNRNKIFELLAALMHLGEVRFTEFSSREGEFSQISDIKHVVDSLDLVSSLFGIEKDQIITLVTSRVITVGKEEFRRGLSVEQAQDARDAIAKAVYGQLFEWIVYTINKSIAVVDEASVYACISVLDIFGFENLENNSFEQLLINYTNEALQQQFNQFIFKAEQKLYEEEKIEWNFIEFPDNQDCLNLIDSNVNSIFSLLNDECKLPRASDAKFGSRLYGLVDIHDRLYANSKQRRDQEFQINHYAGLVTYSTNHFIDKNRDDIPKATLEILMTSTNTFMIDVLSEQSKDTSSSSSSFSKKGSVTSQFKHQLQELLRKISTTKPHYIRCLKPNDKNEPHNFDRVLSAEQLRCGGVLEAVRIARSGFSIRMKHLDFYDRYAFLANNSKTTTGEKLPIVITVAGAEDGTKSQCDLLIKNIISSIKESNIDFTSWKDILEKLEMRQGVQIGKTLVFLRKMAYDLLESFRVRTLINAASMIQRFFSAAMTRTHFIRMRNATRIIQRVYRGVITRRYVKRHRQDIKTLLIQTWWRSRSNHNLYKLIRSSVVRLQRKWRQYVRNDSILSAIISIQRVWKRSVAKIRATARYLQKQKEKQMELERQREREESELKIQKALEAAAAADEEAKESKEAKAIILADMKEKVSEIELLKAEVEKLKNKVKEEQELRQQVEEKYHKAEEKYLKAEEKLETLKKTATITAVTTNSSSNSSNNNNNSAEMDIKISNESKEEVEEKQKEKVDDDSHDSQDKVKVPDSRASLSSPLISTVTKTDNSTTTSARRGSTGTSILGNTSGRRRSRNGSQVLISSAMNTRGLLTHVSPKDLVPSSPTKATPSAPSSPTESENHSSIVAYKKNLHYFRENLSKGLRAHVFEGNKISKDCVVRYEDPGNLVFTAANTSWIFFSTPVHIDTIPISDIIEITAGLPKNHSSVLGGNMSSDSRSLNIDIHVEFHAPRSVIFKLASKDERNKLLTGLRSLMKDIHISSPLKDTANLLDTPSKKLDFDSNSNNNLIYSNNSIRNSGQNMNSMLEDSPPLPPLSTTYGSNVGNNNGNNTSMLVDDGARDELQKARVLIREYENEIMRMRKKEAEYQRDSRVRVQLSRRLEQVLIDRQELKEKLLSYKSMRG